MCYFFLKICTLCDSFVLSVKEVVVLAENKGGIIDQECTQMHLTTVLNHTLDYKNSYNVFWKVCV